MCMPIPNYLAISACEEAGGEYDSLKLSCIIPNTVTNPIPIPESDESESEAGPPYAIIGTIVFAMMIIIPAVIKKSRKKKSKEIVINKKKDSKKEFERQNAIRKAKEEKNRIEDQKIEDQRKEKLKEKKKIDDEFEKQKQLWIKNEADKAEQKRIKENKPEIKIESKNASSKTATEGYEYLQGFKKIADLKKSSKYVEALKICNNFLKIEPTDFLMIQEKIGVLESMEKFKEILPLYDRLSELKPRLKYWHLKSKAEILIKMRKYPEAVQLCDESLKLKFKEYTVDTRNRAQSYADNPETAESVEKTASVQTTIPHIKITSSTNIASAGYDESQRMLEILFTSKTLYQFFEIPKDLFLKLMDSESKGTFFHEHIKDRFQYQRLETSNLKSEKHPNNKEVRTLNQNPCPKCGIIPNIEDIESVFGMRQSDGRSIRQSYCKKCRSSPLPVGNNLVENGEEESRKERLRKIKEKRLLKEAEREKEREQRGREIEEEAKLVAQKNKEDSLDELNKLISLSLKIIRENPAGIDQRTLMKKLETSEENFERVLPRILRLRNISREVKLVNGVYNYIIEEVESSVITESSPRKKLSQETKKKKKPTTNPKVSPTTIKLSSSSSRGSFFPTKQNVINYIQKHQPVTSGELVANFGTTVFEILMKLDATTSGSGEVKYTDDEKWTLSTYSK